MTLKHLLPVMFTSLLVFSSTEAHHSAAAFFDLDATISVEGTITAAKLLNPHSYYRVTTDDGVDWAWESAGTWTALAKAGWSEEALPIGTRILISGTPAHGDKPIARFTSIAAYGPTTDSNMMILVGLDVFGRGRPDWFERVRQLGVPCENGVADCTRVSKEARQTLQDEFGSIGVWSAFEPKGSE